MVSGIASAAAMEYGVGGMTQESSNPLRRAGLEGWAFGCLLGTVGGIVFSIALGQVMAGLCFLFFLAAVFRGEARWRMPVAAWLGFAFVVVAVAGSWRMGGVEGLWGRCGKLLWFLLLPVSASLVTSSRRVMQVVWAFLGGGALLALRDLILHPVRAARKPVPDFLTSLIDKGSMTDGQMLMLAVVVCTVVALVFMRNGRPVPRWVWWMLALQILGLLVNFKRGSWFCAVLLVGALLATHLRWRGIILAAVVVAGVAALPPVWHRLGGLKEELSRPDGRLAMWTRVTPALVREHPAGIGYGRLDNRMMKEAWPGIEPDRNHLHANWAQVLVETGWAGLALYLAWMGWGLVRAAWRAVRVSASGVPLDKVVAPVLLLVLAGLNLNGLVEYNFGDTELMFIYAIWLGVGGAGEAPTDGAAD